MKILLPCDFSQCSEEAIRRALELAERLGGSITLLHVYLEPVYPTIEGSALMLDRETIEQSVRDMTAALEELRDKSLRPGVPIDVRVVEGTPAEVVCRLAAAEAYDLIVMGTHGRTGLGHLFLGSVAERVVRMAPCPVLTVRAAQPAHEHRHHMPAVPLL
ncbi:MAG TPA: universal stress protein [Polyangia bacterium]|jgi:nucleotide-binding universal stress UspA family protein|nr:universal stress protein [Polyangia bacterium]